MLRIDEAWALSSLGPGKVCFMGEKSLSREHEEDLEPWLLRWMRIIRQEPENPEMAKDRPHGYQSPEVLEEAWVAVVANNELEHYTWRHLRREGGLLRSIEW